MSGQAGRAVEGLPVIDARKSVTIIVTDADIKGANRKDPRDCVMARACRRLLRGEVRVHLGRVYLKTSKDKWVRYLTPKPLRTEIIAYDRGGTFEPGEYTLPVPHPTKRLGQSIGSNLPAKIKAKKMRRAPHFVTNVRTGPA